MKNHSLAAAAVCASIMAAVWMGWPEPAGDQVWAYQKLRPADYRLLHSDALGFVTAKAHEGLNCTRAMPGRRPSRSGARACW